MVAGRGWAGIAGGGGGELGIPASVLDLRPTIVPPSPLLVPPLAAAPALLAAPLASGPAAVLGLAEGLLLPVEASPFAPPEAPALAAAALSLASHEYFSLALSARSTSEAWFL